MDVTADLDAPCAPEQLFAWVDDLSRYPQWLDIVPRAVALEPNADRPDQPAAWSVDLRGRVGPLARSKRLRMVRTECDPGRRVVFERSEDDGREHARWVLRATVVPLDQGSRLTMELHYGGGFWGPVLERLLGDEISRSRDRLLACVEADATR